MLAGSVFWGDVDEPMSKPTGLPEPRQQAIRWTSADLDGPAEAGGTSDLQSQYVVPAGRGGLRVGERGLKREQDGLNRVVGCFVQQ